MMSIEDRLKVAYENVAYYGDGTWVTNSYQRANQVRFESDVMKFHKASPSMLEIPQFFCCIGS